MAAVRAAGRRLHLAGLGAGDRIGVRIPSGTNELYISILAIMLIGGGVRPGRRRRSRTSAPGWCSARPGWPAILRAGGDIVTDKKRPRPFPAPRTAAPDDDAWVIFTSGSTGTPKGVAVPHRSAAAFVDAEARIFLRDEPVGPQDRVLAGLSVAFDASCEEMWLAWRHGACLVPAPRALVRTGMDLGPWLISHGITVVSTVPTLAALWPAEALENVRLLIFGGEACPPELAERLAVEGREVWNTYGPTEATVVACAAPLGGTGPVRIGLPLDGWDLAVVDSDDVPVGRGRNRRTHHRRRRPGPLPRPAEGRGKIRPHAGAGRGTAPTAPATSSATNPRGLIFMGRADEQVKLGGRRIELGEIDAALQSLPGVAGAAAAVRTTAAGNQVLVGYLAPAGAGELDLAAATGTAARHASPQRSSRC